MTRGWRKFSQWIGLFRWVFSKTGSGWGGGGGVRDTGRMPMEVILSRSRSCNKMKVKYRLIVSLANDCHREYNFFPLSQTIDFRNCVALLGFSILPHNDLFLWLFMYFPNSSNIRLDVWRRVKDAQQTVYPNIYISNRLQTINFSRGQISLHISALNFFGSTSLNVIFFFFFKSRIQGRFISLLFSASHKKPVDPSKRNKCHNM